MVLVDDVILGQILTAAQGQNPARQAAGEVLQHVEALVEPGIRRPEPHLPQGRRDQPEAAIGFEAHLLQGAAQLVAAGQH